MMMLDMQPLTRRFLLKDMNDYKAHMRLENNGWAYVDVILEDDGATQKRVHRSETNPRNYLVVVGDAYLGCDYVDLYSDDPLDADRVAGVIGSYSEADLLARSRSSQSEDDTALTLTLVGLSVPQQDAAWKYDYLEENVKGSSKRLKMTAVLAATLAAMPRYAGIIERAVEDEEVNEYARGMLELVHQHRVPSSLVGGN
jgi:hypothetical protein